MSGKIKKSELPKGVSVSKYDMERAKYFLGIMHFGDSYYVPVSKELDKLVKQHGIYTMSDVLQDAIGAVYMQIRDSVGAGIHSSISQDIAHGFNKLFDKALSEKINKGFLQIEDKKNDEKK